MLGNRLEKGCWVLLGCLALSCSVDDQIPLDKQSSAFELEECVEDPAWEKLLENAPALNDAPGHIVRKNSDFTHELSSSIRVMRNFYSEVDTITAILVMDDAQGRGMNLPEYEFEIRGIGCQGMSVKRLSSNAMVAVDSFHQSRFDSKQPLRFSVEVFEKLGNDDSGNPLGLVSRALYVVAANRFVREPVFEPALSGSAVYSDDFSMTYDAEPATLAKAELFQSDGEEEGVRATEPVEDTGKIVFKSEHRIPRPTGVQLTRVRKFEQTGAIKSYVHLEESFPLPEFAEEKAIEIDRSSRRVIETSLNEKVPAIVNIEKCTWPGDVKDVPEQIEPGYASIIKNTKDLVESVELIVKHSAIGQDRASASIARPPLVFQAKVTLNKKHIDWLKKRYADRLKPPEYQITPVVLLHPTGCEEFPLLNLPPTESEDTYAHQGNWLMKRNFVDAHEEGGVAQRIYRNEASGIPFRLVVFIQGFTYFTINIQRFFHEYTVMDLSSLRRNQGARFDPTDMSAHYDHFNQQGVVVSDIASQGTTRVGGYFQYAQGQIVQFPELSLDDGRAYGAWFRAKKMPTYKNMEEIVLRRTWNKEAAGVKFNFQEHVAIPKTALRLVP